MSTETTTKQPAIPPLPASNCSVLPCPFCGSPAEYRDSSYPTQRREWVSWWLLQCSNHECAIWASGASKSAALAKWNKRAPIAQNDKLSD